MKPAVALALVLGLGQLGGLASAQVSEGDPRNVEDPRDVKDPRSAADPRQVDTDPLDDAPGPKLYDALYEAGQEERLARLFHENSWEILKYIDGYCEAWLAMVERGDLETETGREKIAQVQAKGRRLAQLADTSIGTSRFSNYVETFYGWDPTQQALLREGQALYQEGIALARAAASAEAAQAALTPLTQALSRARELGDTWGQAMALTAIGKLQAMAGLTREALTTLEDAVRHGREVRDLDSVWEALSVRYEAAMRTHEYERAGAALQEQYLIAQDVGDEDVAKRVLQQLVNLEVYKKAG